MDTHLRQAVISCLLLATGNSSIWAQTIWPSKPIRVISAESRVGSSNILCALFLSKSRCEFFVIFEKNSAAE